VKVLDLFSGIGGFSLGLEQAGMKTAAFCEIETSPQKVLNKWWPLIPVWKDIRELNFCLKKALKSFAAVSPAKIYQPLAKVLDLPANVVDSGGNCYAPFAWFDQSTQSWRTWQCCLIEGWELYSEAWPKAGMTRNGVAYRLVMSEPHTSENESGLLPTLNSQGGNTVRTQTRQQNGSQEHMQTTLYHKGLLPTLTVNGNHNYKGCSKTSGDGIITALKKNMLPTLCANEGKGSSRDRYKGSPNFRGAKMSEGLRTTSSDPIYLNPLFAEAVMGYPLGFTDLETQLSQQSQDSSGSIL
jgi:C-5 cytosine-specific DNA methylase